MRCVCGGGGSQVNRFNKSTDRAVLITDKHLYKLEPRKQYKVLKRTPLDQVSPRDTHTYMYTHAYIHTHTHTYIHSRI